MVKRFKPQLDLKVQTNWAAGHGPRDIVRGDADAALLIGATLKHDMAPVTLPKREYMERAAKLWDELGLPKLRPQSPWFGDPQGDWLPQWEAAAKRAVEGRYLDNGSASEKLQRTGLKPETKFRPE